MQREIIYTALFDRLSNLRNINTTEKYLIPASPFKIYVAWSNIFISNQYVLDASTGEEFEEIMSGTPATGQYKVANGVYTFAEADVDVPVKITYQFSGIKNAYLSVIGWNNVSPDEMPALFLVPKSETNIPVRGLPSNWQLDLDIYLYVNAPENPMTSPSTLINPLLDEIEELLAPDDFPNDVCTLGRLVSHAWISGQILREEGRITGTEIAIIPINILVPS